ncbi:MAG: hypothetical protein C5B59_09580 [Bacteroidetes bacterium]|nr:MAG: hypothetical protein C5B59_09580 [Bacteroidota bacterium]
MKKFLSLVVIASVIYLSSTAQTLQTPRPSPPQYVKQDFGLSYIELSYSRPAVRGRKIFGDLVPYGKVWRTGANNATTLTFADDVIIGGAKVPAGKYGLLTIPGENEWTIIISKQTDVTNPADYKQDQDLVRVPVKSQSLPYPVESMTISFDNVASNTCDLGLRWSNTLVSLPIKTEIDSKIMDQINTAMNKDNRPYYSAALYYIDNGKDLNKALEWLNKAGEQDPKAFYVFYQKARAQAMLGKKQEAIQTAQQSIQLAKEAKNSDYVSLNEKLIASLK